MGSDQLDIQIDKEQIQNKLNCRKKERKGNDRIPVKNRKVAKKVMYTVYVIKFAVVGDKRKARKVFNFHLPPRNSFLVINAKNSGEKIYSR